VSCREDASRKRKDNAAINFSALTKMTLTMPKRDTSTKAGIKSKRFKVGWDNDYLMKVLGLQMCLPWDTVPLASPPIVALPSPHQNPKTMATRHPYQVSTPKSMAPSAGGPMAVALTALALFVAPSAMWAQTLFVNDTEFPANTTDMMAVLTAAGVTYDTHDAHALGTAPTSTQMGNYDLVIWYTGTDGTNLVFWDALTEITDHIITGKKLWIIGQDLLYALHGSAPRVFNAGEFLYDFMGLASYDLQSYGDDGNAGVPQMNAASGVSAYFAPTLEWNFATLWWADGVTPLPGVRPIYEMGPITYIFEGYPSMVYNYEPGARNVMSTFFEPTYINTPANRALFVQQTIAYMGLISGIGDRPSVDDRLRFSTNPATDVVDVLCGERINGIAMHDTHGRLVYSAAGSMSDRQQLPLQGMADGLYLVSVITASNERLTGRLVKE